MNARLIRGMARALLGHTSGEGGMDVKLRMKVILCVLLVAFAAASLLAVLSDLGVLSGAEPASADAYAYELRTWQGRIGVFSPPDSNQPVAVADVYVQDLPITDRLALGRGVAAESREEAARLLEDYGA